MGKADELHKKMIALAQVREKAEVRRMALREQGQDYGRAEYEVAAQEADLAADMFWDATYAWRAAVRREANPGFWRRLGWFN